MSTDQLDDKQLWSLAHAQDQSFVNQFATALIGVGALFFAYGAVPRPLIRLMIALIGFSGSLILWLHMFALRKDFYGLRNELQSRNQQFFSKLKMAQSWRSIGRNRYLYWPVSRLITYSMGLISWGWATIILIRFVPGPILWALSVDWVILGLILAIHRQWRDLHPDP